MRRLRLTFCVPVLVAAMVFAVAAPLSAADAPGASGAHPPKAAPSHGQGEEHGSGEVPLDFKSDLALWSVVVFVVFLFILGKFAWGPLSAGLNKREEGIRKNIADAEQARLKAEKMLAEHAEKLNKVQDEVREILAEARRDAEHAKQEIVSEAQREAEATKSRAVSEINRARDAALKDVFEVMSAQVANATEHVLGRSLSGADQDRLIEEALAQVSSK